MRLVDADEFEKRIKPYDTEDNIDKALYNFAHYHLITTPSAQPEQRKGKWEYSDDLEETLVCSACRYDTMDYEPSNFCPNCGADMRGEG